MPKRPTKWNRASGPAIAAAPRAAADSLGLEMSTKASRNECRAPDGVTLVYSAAGSGAPGLVFVHGGLADRPFWASQLDFFAARHRTIALDLAGHGESGTKRKIWSIPAFGSDIRAVVNAESLSKIVIIGNSLGGPAAVEGALLLPGRVVGVVGVDTFHSISPVITEEEANQRVEMFGRDFAAGVREMTKALFHPDADPTVMADAERRMAKSDPEAALKMFRGLAGYDMGASVRRLAVPLRAVNGDLYPTDLECNRKIKPDFDAVVMPHMGHYPMLERPDVFNALLAEVIRGLIDGK